MDTVMIVRKTIRCIQPLICVFMLTASQDVFSQDGNSTAKAPKEKVFYWYRNYDSETLKQLLYLAFSKTEDFHPSSEFARSDEVPQGRALREIAATKRSLNINLINVVPDEVRARDLLPIYVASDAGLIGLRVCVINTRDSAKFENIRSLQDIEQEGIVFGQSAHWPDTKILRANGMEVVTHVAYEPLYTMLRGNRFNCFLRGVGEVISDLKQFGGDDLVVEKNLLFSYPSTTLFFVSKEDKALAARVELGLRRAVLDGSFSEFFKEYYEPSMKELGIESRRVIRLNNPLLTDEMLKNLTRPPIFGDAKLLTY